jgi:hypothetical protein
LATGHIAGGRRNDDSALDEEHEVVDLAGIVAAVRHRDDDRPRRRGVDPVADGEGGPPAVVVDDGANGRVRLCESSDWLDRGVVRGVNDDEHFEVIAGHSKDAFEAGDDVLALVVGGDND